MGTSLALEDEAFREERLQGWGKCGHAALEVPLQTITNQRQQFRRS